MAQEEIRWMTNLEPEKRTFAMLYIAICALSSVIIFLAVVVKSRDSDISSANKKIIECERRVGDQKEIAGNVKDVNGKLVAAIIQHYDSILLSKEVMRQETFDARSKRIRLYIQNTKKILE